MDMPIGRFIIWGGTSLLAFLFVADWCFPKSLPEPARDAIEKPIIRIASIQQPTERIVIDTPAHDCPATDAGRGCGSGRAIATAIVRVSGSASDSNRR